MVGVVRIGDRLVGDGYKVFVIAEIGINHQGDINIAKQLIDSAKICGADAVKFQKREISKVLVREALDKPYCGYASYGDTYGEHRKKLELSREAYRDLKQYCKQAKIMFMASAWDETSADFLDELGVPAFKIASADLTNVPLLEHIGRKGKPVLLSTGMSDLDEIDEAVYTLRDECGCDLILMQCTSTYPCAISDVNLRAIPMLKERYGCPVGYSGHDYGIVIPVVATILGACVIEKHFTLDRTWKGSDHANSLEPYALSKLVKDIQQIHDALGDGQKRLLEVEKPIREKLAKSIVAARAIRKGELITRDMLTTKSPGTGISPRLIYKICGKTAKRDIEEDTIISEEDLS